MDESSEYKTGLFAFVRAFGARWFVAMSGPFTVPIAVLLAFFVDSKFQKVLFTTLAVVCAVFSSYWIWRRERKAKLAVQEELAAERAKNAIAVIRASITCVVLDHSYDTKRATSYCTLILRAVVCNESAMPATIRDFKCRLSLNGDEFYGRRVPVTGYERVQEILEHRAWEPTRRRVKEQLRDLVSGNEVPLTNSEHRDGWLAFQFPDLPLDWTREKVLAHGVVRLGATDNRGTEHSGVPSSIVGCEDRILLDERR